MISRAILRTVFAKEGKLEKIRRIIGLDPGLRNTGWGIIQIAGNRLQHLANGTVRSRQTDPLAQRLQQLYAGLDEIISDWTPDCAAAETTFVNKNPEATLKLGQARGVVLLAPANPRRRTYGDAGSRARAVRRRHGHGEQ